MRIFADIYQTGAKDAINLIRSGIQKGLPVDYCLDAVEKTLGATSEVKHEEA